MFAHFLILLLKYLSSQLKEFGDDLLYVLPLSVGIHSSPTCSAKQHSVQAPISGQVLWK